MPRPRRGALPDNVVGEQVRLALTEARGVGLSVAKLVMATELSPYQVGRGLRWYKEVGAQIYTAPITRDRDGFHLPSDVTDLLVYERSECRVVATRLERLVSGTFVPHAALFPTDQAVTVVLPQLQGIAAQLHSFATGP
ncbi:MAG: hypothetical protein ABIS86_22025 [Streptosporangiaceae bacterium]